VTASEMAQPMVDAQRFRRASFPLPRPGTLRTATAAPALSLRPVRATPGRRRACAGTGIRRTWTGRWRPWPPCAGRARRWCDGAAGHRRLVPGLRGRGCGTAAGLLGGAGLGARLARKHPSRGRRGRWRALVRAGADLAGDGALSGCRATSSGQALLDGAANLRCGLRIMGATVPRDGVVSRGMRGVAADWGPFHSTRKREDMRQWLRAQDYCQPRLPRPCDARSCGRTPVRSPDPQAWRTGMPRLVTSRISVSGSGSATCGISISEPSDSTTVVRGVPRSCTRRKAMLAGRQGLRLAPVLDAPGGVGHAQPVDRRQDQLRDAHQKRRDEDQEHEARDHLPELHGQKDQASQREKAQRQAAGAGLVCEVVFHETKWPSDSGRILTGHGRGAGRSVLLFRFGAGRETMPVCLRWTVAEAVDRAVPHPPPGRVSPA
jgi:hypothetical protein